MTITLSYIQAEQLIRKINQGETEVQVSPDLGLTQVMVSLDADDVLFPDGSRLTREQLETICNNQTACFRIKNGDIGKIQAFSDVTNRFASLMPTQSAPTLLLAGFPMHRIKNTDPYRDTLSKIKATKPFGQVLDTTMGLGYTAIQASAKAEQVMTIELDPTVIEIARQNPWSRQLFTNENIRLIQGDSFERIVEFEDNSFDRIIHDPPTFSLAGELYSAEFYGELWRVLAPKGRLFHYIGDPSSHSGKRVTRGAVRRLQEVGFRTVRPAPQAFGLVAFP